MMAGARATQVQCGQCGEWVSVPDDMPLDPAWLTGDAPWTVPAHTCLADPLDRAFMVAEIRARKGGTRARIEQFRETL